MVFCPKKRLKNNFGIRLLRSETFEQEQTEPTEKPPPLSPLPPVQSIPGRVSVLSTDSISVIYHQNREVIFESFLSRSSCHSRIAATNSA